MPRPDDAWRLLVDAVVSGEEAAAFAETKLPALAPGETWLRLRIQVRYVGSGAPEQLVRANDFTVVYQVAGVNYETPVVAAWPELEVGTAQDEPRGLTLWFSIPLEAAFAILLWDAFDQPPGTYQWPLPTRLEGSRPTSGPPQWDPPASGEWMTLSGGKTEWPLGREYAAGSVSGRFAIVDWKKPKGPPSCALIVVFESDAGDSEGLTDVKALAGSSVLKFASWSPSSQRRWIPNVTSGCDWRVDLAWVGTLFGPDSDAVADFIWRTTQLGPGWDGLAAVSRDPERAAVLERVRSITASNPDAAQALKNALDKRWYAGIRFVEKDKGHRQARADAITALVLRGELKPSEVAVLYEPFAAAIPLEVVGHDTP